MHFLSCDLDKWDDARIDTLILSVFSDERPLRGAAGLADWRLCGRLSRLVLKGAIGSRRGETLMIPPGRRLPVRRIMLFGLGDSRKFDDEVFRQHVRWICDVAKRAGSEDIALQLPGRATGIIGARKALEMWSDEVRKDPWEIKMTIIDSATAQKDMSDLLRALAPKRRPQELSGPVVANKGDASPASGRGG